jgi:Ribbon-helix-helix protein, copG family
MATTLRLNPDEAKALHAAAVQSGLSQHEIVRRAVRRGLGLDESTQQAASAPALPSWIKPARRAYRSAHPRLTLPEGASTVDVLDDVREDRV